jgi:hypothetical protein
VPDDPPTSDPSHRRAGVVVLVLLAAAAGATFALRRPPPGTTLTPAVTRPGELPRDPLAYVPASARTLVVADLRRLREAPATRGWFAPEPGAEPTCQEAIARRVHTVALVVPRLPADEFAFVAAGDLTPSDLARCARGAEEITRDGFTLSVVRSRRDGGASGLLAWTPQGVVLVGAAAVVESLLDRGIDAARGHAARPVLDGLRPLVSSDAALWGLHLADREAPPDDPLATVSAGALSVTVTDALRADATLRCDDRAHASRLLEHLERLRGAMAPELTQPALRTMLEGARAELDGADVRVHTALDGDGVRAIGAVVIALGRGFARGL